METARSFAAWRIALIGEAAHVLPPIGAQGLNLGLRDAATIAEAVVDARRTGEDIGAAAVLARYDGLRRPDVASRAMAVDMLNRTLLSDFLPLQGARQLSFFLLRTLGPLRRAAHARRRDAGAFPAAPDAGRGAVKLSHMNTHSIFGRPAATIIC